jgi:hypothetical protein
MARITVTGFGESVGLVGRLLDAAASKADAQVEGPHLVVSQDNPARMQAQTEVAATVSVTFEAEPV